MVKISDLTQLSGASVNNISFLPIVDVNDNTQSSSGTTKKVMRSSLFYKSFFSNEGIGVGGADPSLYNGVGISFPAAQNPSTDVNTLDDYEEGNWTPIIVGSTTAGSATYSNRSGTYIKIGRLVHITCWINWTGGTGTGNLRVTGLPFTSSTIYTSFAVAWFIDIGTGANRIGTAYNDINNNRIILYTQIVGGGAGADVAYDAAGNMQFSGCYISVD